MEGVRVRKIFGVITEAKKKKNHESGIKSGIAVERKIEL